MGEKTEGLDRRGFLASLGLGAGAAAAGAAGVAAATGPAVAAETEDEKLKARYKVTDHVKAFYRVNRY
jgi:hypothetical protein